MSSDLLRLSQVVHHPSHGYGMICQVRRDDPIPYTVRFKRPDGTRRELPMTGNHLTPVGNEHYFSWAKVKPTGPAPEAGFQLSSAEKLFRRKS